MSKHKKRAYISEARKAQAAETRIRILETAKNLFLSKGIDPVTIEKLAEVAKVSAPTIYSLFQSKRGILRALMDEALPTDQRLALVEESRLQKSPKRRLEVTAKITRQMYDAEKALMDIFRGASALDPELRELEKEREQRRYDRQEMTIVAMAEEKSFAKGLSSSKARDILWAFTGRDMYRMFVIEREWTSEKYEKWLAQLLIKTLVAEDL